MELQSNNQYSNFPINNFSKNPSNMKSSKEVNSSSEDIYKILGHTMDYISDAFFLLNTKGDINYVNKKGCELLNRSHHELIDKNMWELFPQRVGQMPYLQFQRAMQTNEQCDFESYYEDGKMWFEHRAIPTNGGLSVFVQDITERKLANQKLIEDATLLERTNKQLSDFCNIVSHNLRSPLVNISILVDFIESSEDIEEQLLLIGKIKPVVNSLNDTFNELVETLQVRQNTDVVIEKLSFNHVFDKVLVNFQPRIDLYGLNLTLDFEAANSIAYSRKYLESIFTNLVSNAFKYKSPDKILSIEVKTEKRGKNVILSFKDNGLGIDLDKHGNNIFKLGKVFHRHPQARGFGLFMTKNQIDSMGGKIWVESSVNKGTTFFIEFIIDN